MGGPGGGEWGRELGVVYKMKNIERKRERASLMRGLDLCLSMFRRMNIDKKKLC